MLTGQTATKTNAPANDRLESFGIYQRACELFDAFWNDSEILGKDFRGRELVRQQVRSLDSVCANIEEGYGRGYNKELPQHLKISRGEARESRGRYLRCRQLLPATVISQRIAALDHIIGGLTNTINTIEAKQKQKRVVDAPALVTRHPSPVTSPSQ